MARFAGNPVPPLEAPPLPAAPRAPRFGGVRLDTPALIAVPAAPRVAEAELGPTVGAEILPFEPAPASPQDPMVADFEASTSRLERVTAPLKAGLKQVQQSVQGIGADVAARRLREVDEITAPDAPAPTGAIPRRIAENRTLARQGAETALTDSTGSMARLQGEIEALPQNPAARAMVQAKTTREAFDHFWRDPIGVIQSIGLQSAPASLAGIAGGVVAGPVGMGAVSAASEYASGIVEGLAEEGIDVRDAAALQRAFQDPELMTRLRRKAAIGGSIIGAFDAASFGLASKTLAPRFIGNRVARELVNVPAQTVAQGASGAAGEATKQLVNEGAVTKPGAVLAEAVGETVTTPADILAATRSGRSTGRAERPDATVPPAPADAIPAETVIGAEAAPEPRQPSKEELKAVLDDERPVAEIIKERDAAANWQPGYDWQDVPEGAVLPAGVQVEMNMETGKQRARMAPRPGSPEAPVRVETPADTMAGAERTAEPTPAQAEAGNYRKRHVKWQGLDIAIETEAGQSRSGIAPDGAPWSVEMPAPYGYIKRTEGKDGDQVDVYLGPQPQARHVFVVDQIDPATGKFDEHKVMAGFPDAGSAVRAYDAAFSDASGSKRMGAITLMPVAAFKTWLAKGDTKKPIAYRAPIKEKPTAEAAAFNRSEAARRAIDTRKANRGALNVFEFIAANGGLSPEDPNIGDVHTILGRKQQLVPLYGALIRRGGMPLDRARELIEEAGYIGRGAGTEHQTTDINDLLSVLDRQARGGNVYSAADATEAVEQDRQRADEQERDREAAALSGVLELAKQNGLNLTDDEAREAAALIRQGVDELDAVAHAAERAGFAYADEIAETPREVPDEDFSLPARDNRQGPRQDVAAPARDGQPEAGPDGRAAQGSASARQQPRGRDEAAGEAQVQVTRDVAGVAVTFPDRDHAELYELGLAAARGAGLEGVDLARLVQAWGASSADTLLDDAAIYADDVQQRARRGKPAAADRLLRSEDYDHVGVVEVPGRPPAQVKQKPKTFVPSVRQQLPERIGALDEPKRPTPFLTSRNVDKTDAGPQRVIPGAEKISDRQLVERRMEGPAKAKAPQKPADDGLFNVAGRGQKELFAAEARGPNQAASPDDVFTALRSALDRLGLKDIGLRVVGAIRDGSGSARSEAGVYRPALKTIEVAMQGDTRWTLNHEAIHALRDLGLFTEQEWDVLRAAVQRDARRMSDVRTRYAGHGLTKEQLVEEAIADLYGDWQDNRARTVPKVLHVFHRIRNTLRAIGNALRGLGFKSAEDVLAAIERGEIGGRPREDVVAFVKRWFTNPAGTAESLTVVSVGQAEAERVKRETGLDIGGRQHVIASDYLGHIRRRHGPGSQDRTPVSPEDFARLAEIVANPDRVYRSDQDHRGMPVIKYEKTIGNRYVAAEFMRPAHSELVLLSFLKRPTGSDARLSAPPDLNAQDERGGSPNVGLDEPGDKYSVPRATPPAQAGMLTALTRGQPLDRAMRLPFALFGGLDAKGEWKPGQKLSAKAGQIISGAKFSDHGRFAFMNPVFETVRRGLIDRYGLPGAYQDRDRGRALDERRVMLQGAEVMKTLRDQKVGPEEAKVLQAILNGERVAATDMEKLADPIRKAIDDLGQEAVNLGLVSAESYERNRGSYVHRVYLRHEADQDALARWIGKFQGRRRKKLMGDELKGRGMTLDIELERLQRTRLAGEGRPVPGDKFRVLDRVAENIDEQDPARPRVLERAYLPAEAEVPSHYAGWRDAGTWEVRAVRGAMALLWRDFTKTEREQMGEILDARYTVAKTFMLMAHDLANGRFYKDVAANAEWARKEIPDERWVDAAEYHGQNPVGFPHVRNQEVEWVKVPATDIADTGGKKKWGALAGLFVRAEIWRDLNELDQMSRPSFWNRLMTQWKLNKTARSPVVHMNNVMSNLMFMDMADIRLQDLVAGVRAYAKGTADYEEAAANGALGADQLSQELRRNTLEPILEELSGQVRGNARGGLMGRIGALGRIASTIWDKAKAADRKMVDLYRMEDDVFRMAAYMRRRALGDTPKEAADFARQQFLDYDIRAPWINWARRTALPFIAYTYRAVPVIAHSIATRPWKLAKYFAVAYALNSLAYMLAPGDEDDERRVMREQEKGHTWLGVPRMLRMPWRDRDGNPVFLDIRRWIPAGDVFDFSQGSSAIGVPAWLQFGGPLMLAFEFYLNKKAFDGKPIANLLTDTLWERTRKTSDWLYKSWMPSAPWVPNSWYSTRISEAARGVRDASGRPQSLPQAVASSVGIKVRSHDLDTARKFRVIEFDKEARELRTQRRTLQRDLARERLSPDEFKAQNEAISQKFVALNKRRRETLGARSGQPTQ